MKLKDLARQILKEDTWGASPSAAGAMSPGRSPTAKSPNAALYNPKPEVEKLVHNVEQAEDTEEKKLDNNVAQKLVGKNVTVKASKGSVGQAEQDYTIDVSAVEVNNLNDVFYIVLKGTEKGSGKESDYYVNTNFQVKINAASAPEEKENPAQPAPAAQPQSKLKQVGGMISTPALNTHAARNIVPQG
jgi:hypothetical protein